MIRPSPRIYLCRITLAALTFLLFLCPISFAAHGISIDGKVKYPADFSRFSYTSDKAVKGGHLVLHGLGTFDKMNPFTLKGDSPDGLSMLVFESLAVKSLDEPFAEYGLIARDIELGADKLSVIFTLNEQAKFSDGTPVTCEDVKFSFETLTGDKADPRFQFYYKDIKNVEILDSSRVRFNFHQPNRELHLIAAELPILSKKFYTENPFGDSSLVPPVGSGPYTVETFKPGKMITYKRNPEYWAIDHPARRNQFNFDRITFKFFKDQSVSLEAFKAHDFDFMEINVAKQWARDLDGPKFTSKEMIKEPLAHKNNQGMQGFVMNTRRPLFQDVRVRKAMSLAFDFEWTNKSLFHGQYTRSSSYFSNSQLAATGLPEGLSLKYLLPFKDKLPGEVFTSPLEAPVVQDQASLRNNLRQAKTLLQEVGWTPRDGVLVNSEGKPFEFEVLLYSPFFVRVMEPYAKNLEKLGIKVNIRQVDLALYIQRIKNFEFDMMVNVFGQSQSPGNEQVDYWHSSTADHPGSGNLIGLKNEVVDHLVDKIVYADTQEELAAACQALDRVLWYGYYVVPNWYIPYHRVAYWNRFEKPETLPTYYSPINALMTWWVKGQ
ncbi:MAG: extracellular solute-binding protein [Proteobacteria bacterium]|nr:extracellular solute-binding protein [Pseudomonadota bacterium]MBU1739330.1 extracellular solute-binding protein [Pseudomonadota bacterium]